LERQRADTARRLREKEKQIHQVKEGKKLQDALERAKVEDEVRRAGGALKELKENGTRAALRRQMDVAEEKLRLEITAAEGEITQYCEDKEERTVALEMDGKRRQRALHRLVRQLERFTANRRGQGFSTPGEEEREATIPLPLSADLTDSEDDEEVRAAELLALAAKPRASSPRKEGNFLAAERLKLFSKVILLTHPPSRVCEFRS